MIKMNTTDSETVIESPKSLLNLRLKELWQYRDLLEMYVRRDIINTYKQTLLGPAWFFIQPIFTTIVFMFIFGGLAGISTDGIPQPLFYLAGITLWNYFSESLNRTSDTFLLNQAVFGKVYFPRLLVPISVTLSGLLKLLIQLSVFVIVYLYYAYTKSGLSPNLYALLLPLLLLLLGGLGLGFGIIISALTTKYRDLKFLLSFAIQLWLYATPVIYPLSVMQGRFHKYLWIIQANPLTSIIETFRFAFLGQGTFSWGGLAYSTLIMVIVLLTGAVIFNKVERNFMDII
jgi:lipopolysaccharide transport system permease protein